MSRLSIIAAMGLTIGLLGCHSADDDSTAEERPNRVATEQPELLEDAEPIDADELRQMLADYDVEPLDPLPELKEERVALGHALFFDPVLSGNLDTSCATCHNPCTMGGDDRSLSVGTGFMELDDLRLPGEDRLFVARHATELFNRGDHRWETMFWDARLTEDEAGYFVERIPHRSSSGMAGPALRFPDGLDNLLAAQAMFPVTSRHEMRGRPGDLDIFGKPNEIAPIPDVDRRTMWRVLIERLLNIEGYRQLFGEAYPDRDLDELSFVDAANALADFQIAAFTLLDSPFDQFLAGDDNALSAKAMEGAALFYGDAGCARCHGGALMTDQQAHNIGVPQLGPGREPGQPLDEGVYLRTHGDSSKRFAFRTPPLRNVALTGPWMHNGAYADLESAVRHHFDPVTSLMEYDPSQLEPALRQQLRNEEKIQAEILENLSPLLENPVELKDRDLEALMAFLYSLTSPSAMSLSDLFPDEVPSGLAIEECISSRFLP